MKNKKVIIIGGGPAGMMAAITAAENSSDVILMEKNSEVGKKLRITGGGRCNVTNSGSPTDIMEKVVSNSKFLYKSLNAFTSKELMELIERKGCPLKVEEKGKIFPVSDNSGDVIKVFEELLEEKRVKIYLQCEAKDIVVEDNKVVGVKTSDQKVFLCDAVILATGGVSYPHTGSTGEGHTISKTLGHGVSSLKPSLISMEIREKWLTEMTGISLNSVVIKTRIGKKTIAVDGDLLFTHYGISGPSVFQLSTYLNKVDLPQEGHEISVDFVPKVTQEELKERFISSEYSNKQISTILTEYWPKKFITGLLDKLNIDHSMSMNQLIKKDRNKLMNALKEFKITVLRLRSVKDAIVTSGGIAVKEVNPATMESKLIKGLFFAGEVLDVDALTGGYNLQIAFSTGYVAGMNSVE
ncbi:MAG: NAD(P)/FAD-dependent oxidoreductase [Clostridiaceae bacterium]|nr:NAD(P)/FAD-dependent oxidoreductase [Clostridiaceae bacterium]